MPWKPVVPVYTAFRYEDPSELDALLDYIVNTIWDNARPVVHDDGTTVSYYDGFYAPGSWTELRVSTIGLGDWIYPNEYYAASDETVRRYFCPPTGWPSNNAST